ncbi:granulocyte colony-stimulating factor-like [Discoglossus pictus]
MHSFTYLFALLCLCLGGLAAPLPGQLSSEPEFLENNLEFSRKIGLKAEELRDMMCSNHGLCVEEELGLVKNQLGLQVHLLDQCQAGTFTQVGCFSQLVAGLRDFYSLVRSLPIQELSEPLARLGMDLRDILSNFKEEMETQGILDLNFPPHAVPSYPSVFYEEAGTFLIMSDLAKFVQQVQSALGS